MAKAAPLGFESVTMQEVAGAAARAAQRFDLAAWLRTQASHIAAAVIAVATIGAYVVIVAALNAPTAAHAPRGNSATEPLVATTTTLPAVTTTTSTTAPMPPIVPGPVRAPKGGTYAARSEVDGVERDATLVVAADGTQTLTVGESIRQLRIDWSTGRGVLIASGVPGTDGTCEWTAAAVFVPALLREDRRWASDVSCVTTSPDSPAVTVRRQEEATVARRVRSRIGDEVVDTWLIERRVILTARSNGATTITEESSQEFFAPRLGLNVYTVRRTDTSRPDGEVESVTETISLATATPV